MKNDSSSMKTPGNLIEIEEIILFNQRNFITSSTPYFVTKQSPLYSLKNQNLFIALLI